MNTINNIVKKLRESRLMNEEKINYAELDHLELILLAKQRDQQAFEELLRQYDNLISKYVRNTFVGTGKGDADDIRQIANIAFWEAVSSYDPDVHTKGFGAYAGMIIKRKIIDELRKEDTDKRRLNNLSGSLDDTYTDDDEGGSMTVGDTVASSDLDPEEEYISREAESRLIDFLEKSLSDTERTVIKKYIAGHKVSAIAEETGMKYKSVENAIMRVKNKLAEFIRTSYGESHDMKEAVDLEFSEEEKQILNRAFSKMEEMKSVRESGKRALGQGAATLFEAEDTDDEGEDDEAATEAFLKQCTENPTWKKVNSICNKYGYQLSKYSCVDVYSEKKKVIDVRISPNDPNNRYLPEIYFYHGKYGGENPTFEIQTTSYGALSLEEHDNFIAAVKAAHDMCKEIMKIDLYTLHNYTVR